MGTPSGGPDQAPRLWMGWFSAIWASWPPLSGLVGLSRLGATIGLVDGDLGSFRRPPMPPGDPF